MISHPKVSVIICAYNAGDELAVSLDSVLSQTLKDFEVVLVDDGSTDNTPEICDNYSKIDNRIKVIHKKNGGIASARQVGIDNAIGDYAIHIDADDYVEPNMLESLYQEALINKADMVICDFYEEYPERKELKIQRPIALDSRSVILSIFSGLHGSCWNKLISSDFYKKVRFEKDINVSEDLLYNISVLKLNPKIVYLNKGFYHYKIDVTKSSASRNYSYQTCLQLRAVFDKLCAQFKDDNEVLVKLYSSMIPYLMVQSMNTEEVSNNEYCNYFRDYRRYAFSKSPYALPTKILAFISLFGFKDIALKISKFLKRLRYK